MFRRSPSLSIESLRPRAVPAGLKPRLRAGAAHLVLSCSVAAAVLALVFLGWYPTPLDRISGVGEILQLLLAIDVTLGPLLTIVVFDRRKRSLPLDLACIGALQLAALAYGLHAVEAGRPHHLVFVKDRFEVVSRVDLRPEDRQAAAGNPAASASWTGPRIVAAELPTSDQERRDMLFESVMGGRDVHHYPARYRDIGSQRERIVAKAVPLDALRALNPERLDGLAAGIAKSGRPESRLRFLPVKGPKGDAAMLVDVADAEVIGIVDLMPWR